MPQCNRLRIDPRDGVHVVDYRIENGWVETRTLDCTDSSAATGQQWQWQRLTPEELSFHVMADTVVARWLRRRMGVHQLIQACSDRMAA
jgi:hypothetical protein